MSHQFSFPFIDVSLPRVHIGVNPNTFVATFAKMAVYTPISYGLSSFGTWGIGQLGWGW